jgi:RNA polymerase primary sigma factor
MRAISSDMTTHWLDQAGRQTLLTAAEELHLGGLVRAWQDWQPSADQAPSTVQRRGLRARDRMVAANLRLVAHVTRRARHGLGVPVTDSDLPDLLQAGAIGLQRGVEKFDPTRGYKLSTYVYWWIRQGISRHIDSHGRTIRIPTTHTGTIARAGKVAAALAAHLGRTPSRAELAQELGIRQAELEHLLLIGAGCHSLDAPLPGSTSGDPSALIDMLIVDGAEPLDPRRDQLLELVGMLDAQCQRLIRGRHGLGEPVAGIAELARREGISPHRVRGLIRMAENTLRRLSPAVSAPAAPVAAGPIRDVGEAGDQLELL